MKTIAACVGQILIGQPFLEEALSRGIINYSALAEELVVPISELLKKPVKSGAIMMALRRYQPPTDFRNSLKLKRVIQNLGDITVRSNLTDFTFQNSKTLIHSHSKIMEQLDGYSNVFYAFTRGIYESNIIISTAQKHNILKSFQYEILLGEKAELSAITISLPSDNSKVTGLYYQIFKRLAWEDIALYEVVSTTNEFTILVEDEVVDRAFSVMKRLKD
ncbi:hypothetical protein LX77_01216 [Gelidibacter algens]|uniref:Aspartate kinase n=1 Tax=Gelidibacter algens TaxID=49280 RepID=A0A1A7QZ60_9FLAO|nr:hypothetical protein [Gelidibacter algens]OBX25300.1 hypothetical protein A9996_10695 [Gelidibacter algens]RAJ25800.1 hypothetical protein LX77_01216 [Gelidibacter algens]